MSSQVGNKAEQRARDYLIAQGLHWLESNYRCRWGEIDLIMREQSYLVFVEVRARSSAVFGGAIASVTYGKQKKIVKAATHYLLANKRYNEQPIRFDILGFQGKELQIEWIRNAFSG